MGCSCGNKSKSNGNNRPLSKGILPRTQLPTPIPKEIPKSMVDLPSPPPVSNSAALRRIKQLNQQAVKKSLGK